MDPSREAAGSRDSEPASLALPTVGGFVQLPQSWDSSAGKIQNLVEHACGGVGVLQSAALEVRANHSHKQDWHYLYCISGSFEYREWSLDHQYALQDKDRIELRVRAGQMIFTPPMRNHELRFIEHTVMISISRLSRTHAEHETDVVRL